MLGIFKSFFLPLIESVRCELHPNAGHFTYDDKQGHFLCELFLNTKGIKLRIH